MLNDITPVVLTYNEQPKQCVVRNSRKALLWRNRREPGRQSLPLYLCQAIHRIR